MCVTQCNSGQFRTNKLSETACDHSVWLCLFPPFMKLNDDSEKMKIVYISRTLFLEQRQVDLFRLLSVCNQNLRFGGSDTHYEFIAWILPPRVCSLCSWNWFLIFQILEKLSSLYFETRWTLEFLLNTPSFSSLFFWLKIDFGFNAWRAIQRELDEKIQEFLA